MNFTTKSIIATGAVALGVSLVATPANASPPRLSGACYGQGFETAPVNVPAGQVNGYALYQTAGSWIVTEGSPCRDVNAVLDSSVLNPCRTVRYVPVYPLDFDGSRGRASASPWTWVCKWSPTEIKFNAVEGTAYAVQVRNWPTTVDLRA